MKGYKQLIYLGLVLQFFVFIASFFECEGDTTAFFQAAARLSGRVSLVFFTIFTVYATQNPSVERGSEAMATKMIIARDLAIMHMIHWVFLAVAVKLSGFELVPFRVAGGALAYFMIVAMPTILRGHVIKTISLNIVQNVFIYYVWLIFFMTYISRVTGQTPTATGSMLSYVILLAFTSGLLVWRLYHVFTHRAIDVD